MIRNFLALLLLTFGLTLCYAQDSLWIDVAAVNLSEDMSALSSKNDELVVLLYAFDDTTHLETPLLSASFVLDSMKRKQHLASMPRFNPSSFLLFLLEQDTDRSLEQLEPLVRKNYKAITEAFKQNDRMAIERLLGHDDVLGIKIIQRLSSKLRFDFKGRFKLDKYSYMIVMGH